MSAGGSEIKIWTKISQKDDSGEVKTVWSVVSALKFRNLTVMQMIDGTKLRLTNTERPQKDSDSNSNLAVLHEGGWVTFWSQDNHQFNYGFKLNSSEA